jgi:hypothetical protein
MRPQPGHRGRRRASLEADIAPAAAPRRFYADTVEKLVFVRLAVIRSFAGGDSRLLVKNVSSGGFVSAAVNVVVGIKQSLHDHANADEDAKSNCCCNISKSWAHFVSRCMSLSVFHWYLPTDCLCKLSQWLNC